MLRVSRFARSLPRCACALLAVAVTALTFGALPSPAAADGCTFVLGFATLHDLIPRQVGACLDDERHNPSNGDALQQTTGGLLVWRKADNFTAFTDGYQTWVSGPNGVQQRLNTQRFSWEADSEGFPIVTTLPSSGITPAEAAQIVPLAPATVSTQYPADGARGIEVDWSGTGEDDVHYDVLRRLSVAQAWEELALVPMAGRNTDRYAYVDQTASTGAMYQYAVRAVSASGTPSALSVSPETTAP